jgi:predicted secreted protein
MIIDPISEPKLRQGNQIAYIPVQWRILFAALPLNFRSGVLLNEKRLSSIESCCTLVSGV